MVVSNLLEPIGPVTIPIVEPRALARAAAVREVGGRATITYTLVTRSGKLDRWVARESFMPLQRGG
ncbi:MAG: hypothetical protein GXY55_11580 [Phycisphaerae bacterium]|nr:hypothetical protein [Phycisphaerae bacterium]